MCFCTHVCRQGRNAEIPLKNNFYLGAEKPVFKASTFSGKIRGIIQSSFHEAYNAFTKPAR
jgi:hypothetical protein